MRRRLLVVNLTNNLSGRELCTKYIKNHRKEYQKVIGMYEKMPVADLVQANMGCVLENPLDYSPDEARLLSNIKLSHNYHYVLIGDNRDGILLNLAFSLFHDDYDFSILERIFR